ncbi:ArsR family transcriptional regulator [Actinomyces radicidentis]|uniref:ArsR family transcriptional regulator n=1 Tax=Actinomyces radicidentis TaxID=111015 RepID=A0A0X8JG24_ACTRD|nr:ArsR family transcriptional regulator [Actinomyces radicidentis]
MGWRSTKGQVVGRERLHHPALSDIELDRVLSALSDPIRRDILQRIASDGPQFCGDLDLKYDVAKSTMSYHFKVLRESGLMHTEAIGKHRRITRRDSAIDNLFPGLLQSVGLPPGEGRWQEPAEAQESGAREAS